jgi:hypothetical protein
MDGPNLCLGGFTSVDGFHNTAGNQFVDPLVQGPQPFRRFSDVLRNPMTEKVTLRDNADPFLKCHHKNVPILL